MLPAVRTQRKTAITAKGKISTTTKESGDSDSETDVSTNTAKPKAPTSSPSAGTKKRKRVEDDEEFVLNEDEKEQDEKEEEDDSEPPTDKEEEKELNEDFKQQIDGDEDEERKISEFEKAIKTEELRARLRDQASQMLQSVVNMEMNRDVSEQVVPLNCFIEIVPRVVAYWVGYWKVTTS